jgi:hypothetical protein
MSIQIKSLASLQIPEVWALFNELNMQIEKNTLKDSFEICIGRFVDHNALIFIDLNKYKLISNSCVWSESDHIENETIDIKFLENKVLLSAVYDISKDILSRLISILPVISRLSVDDLCVLKGKEIRLSLGDRAAENALCFSDCCDIKFLVPDAYYLLNQGYSEFRDEVNKLWINWSDRYDIFYWRGATSGIGLDGSLLSAQRTRFVRFVNTSPLNNGFDVKFSRLNCSSSLTDVLIRENCVAGEDPAYKMAFYKYNIDVDGNTNSWPGLYQKLLSGSPVLKINSQYSYKQWYYSKLVPWIHYVPIKDDFSDLIAVGDELRRDPELSIKIGNSGRDLAMSMSYDSECEFFLKRLFDI